MEKVRVGVVGATGMVGQRLLCLLENHPYFEVKLLLAGDSSFGKTYEAAVKNKWKMKQPIPDYARQMTVYHGERDVDVAKREVDMVFCAVSLEKSKVKALEEAYAKAELVVVSNNSACRGLTDVPMLIPEINSYHLSVLPWQKRRLGTKRGFIVTKPNCSIQSYLPPLTPLRGIGIRQVAVTTLQAVSGAGKTLTDMPEIADNVIPYISGEEEKSETEPLKIWGRVEEGNILSANLPQITAQCFRVNVSDGHTAAVYVSFAKKPTLAEIRSLWEREEGILSLSHLPSAPSRLLYYEEDSFRPQPALDRMRDKGMAITVGRLREDTVFHYKFLCLSHNTLRGAAGGALLTAELLYDQGYLCK